MLSHNKICELLSLIYIALIVSLGEIFMKMGSFARLCIFGTKNYPKKSRYHRYFPNESYIILYFVNVSVTYDLVQ